MLLLLGGATVTPVVLKKVIRPRELQKNNTGSVLTDKDCVRGLALEVGKPRAVEVGSYRGMLSCQSWEQGTRRGTRVLGLVRALVA